MGYGIISVRGNTLRLLDMDSIRLGARKDAYERLQLIHHTVCRLINAHRPHLFAIEAPFFGKNVQSMLKLGRAQGVAIAAAMQSGIPVTEYSPRKIKQSITGNGNADKQQVWKMLQQLLSLTEAAPTHYDASDALAVAVCHHFQTGVLISEATTPRLKSWEAFIAQNPGRVSRKDAK
jgi:crossover junction endodeoxyribonuclease RuvC